LDPAYAINLQILENDPTLVALTNNQGFPTTSFKKVIVEADWFPNFHVDGCGACSNPIYELRDRDTGTV